MIRILPFLLLTLFMYTAPIHAQESPVEVEADKTLEWNRTNKTFVARGNALVTKGTASIKADQLVAAYTEDNGGTKINKVTATGETILKNGDMTGYGDGGWYDLTLNQAELTGTRPRIESGADTITADQAIRYDFSANTAKADGNVVLTRAADKLQADSVTAQFTTDGSNTLHTAIATGHVIVTTPDEILYGNRADYNAIDQKIVVTGDVKIVDGQNTLNGSKAVFDMKTQISTLSGGSTETKGRVKAIFYPGQ